MSRIRCACAFTWPLFVPPSVSSLPNQTSLGRIHGTSTFGQVALMILRKPSVLPTMCVKSWRWCWGKYPFRRREMAAADSLRPFVSYGQLLATYHPNTWSVRVAHPYSAGSVYLIMRLNVMDLSSRWVLAGRTGPKARVQTEPHRAQPVTHNTDRECEETGPL